MLWEPVQGRFCLGWSSYFFIMESGLQEEEGFLRIFSIFTIRPILGFCICFTGSYNNKKKRLLDLPETFPGQIQQFFFIQDPGTSTLLFNQPFFLKIFHHTADDLPGSA